MRRVKYQVYQNGEWIDGVGWFHQWTSSYEEFTTGPGNWTYAIIENDDGTIAQADPGKVKFLDSVQDEKAA